MNRQQLIDKGKIWQVYHKNENISQLEPNETLIMFEGTETQCRKFIREYGHTRSYKTGKIRLGKVIYEPVIIESLKQES